MMKQIVVSAVLSAALDNKDCSLIMMLSVSAHNGQSHNHIAAKQFGKKIAKVSF